MMAITAVDTNVLLDILAPGEHAENSRQALRWMRDTGSLVICEAVYSELAAQFRQKGETDDFLGEIGIRLVPSRPDALFAASRAWQVYTQRRGREFQCPRCGRVQGVNCPACGYALRPRLHIIADFLIGGHATIHADQLLTRDRGYYRNYFPALEILQP